MKNRPDYRVLIYPALILAVFIPMSSFAADTSTVTPDQAAFFEKSIRPLLIKNCTGCHGETQQRAGLRLDSREAILKGGRSGPAVVPGDPDHSLLLRVVGYDGPVKMPPSGKLGAMELNGLADWVKMGAPWPSASGTEANKPSTPDYVIKPAQRQFWSFQPIRTLPLPEVKDTAWVRSPIDRFVLSALEAKGLKPAPPADRRTLGRRVYFDLIGLPPTPEELQAFVDDPAPDAYEKLIDRLLASPHYGERWGRHWLDVVRYADSNGLDENVAFGNAFRYRDYVIAAFNKDKPYDQFIEEQLAGDLMPSDNTETRNERLTATGFLGLGAKVLAEPDKPKLEMDIVDEQIDVTGKAFLGLTVSCARCHDHKFDPIPTKDYYGLAGIFKSTRTMENLNTVAQVRLRPLVSPEVEAQIAAGRVKLKAFEDALKATTDGANDRLVHSFKENAARYWLASWELARQPELKSVAETPVKPGDPQRITIEAEKFDRGNVQADFEQYGKGIGIIHTVTNPNFAEWDVTLPAAGPYQLEMRYAAQEARPLKLSINGKVVVEAAAGAVTGSWQPEGQRWEAEGIFQFAAGKNTVRIDRDDAIPHIDKLLIVAAPMPEAKPGAKPLRKAAQIAEATHLNLQVLTRCAAILRPLADDPALKAWPLPENLSDAEFTTAAQKVEGAITASGPLDALSKAAADPKGPFALPDKPEQFYPVSDKDLVGKAAETLKTAQAAAPKPPMAMAVEEGEIGSTRVHIRGSTQNLGDEVPRHFLTILGGDHPLGIDDKHSGRLELAKWIVDPVNPLPARVEVNRIWQGHFGEGIVATPDNFGLMGERPTHPELLDWLAAAFRDNGWSIKRMHRMIMLSSAYRMSAAMNDAAYAIDPGNHLLWRMNRRRLDAEPIRDSILALGGKLDLTLGGSLLTTADHDYVTNDQSNDAARYENARRSVYLPVIRNAVFDMFQAFDFGDPSMVNAHRASTTVAPQALYMMNSPFMIEQSRNFASALLALDRPGDRDRVERAYLMAYGRPPAPTEFARALSFVEAMNGRLTTLEPDPTKRRLRTWQMFCQAILASNEFIYID